MYELDLVLCKVLQDALASATKLDEPGLAAYAAVFLARWGRIDLSRRPIPEMQTTARHAIATFEKIDDRRGVAIARHLLGCSYRGLGQGAAGMDAVARRRLVCGQ